MAQEIGRPVRIFYFTARFQRTFNLAEKDHLHAGGFCSCNQFFIRPAHFRIWLARQHLPPYCRIKRSSYGPDRHLPLAENSESAKNLKASLNCFSTNNQEFQNIFLDLPLGLTRGASSAVSELACTRGR